MLGAYNGTRMVGVSFGITAIEGNRPYHYSHITGVGKDFQGKGIGFKLKLAQREHVIRAGQDMIKWTYDPLQARNAYFNIRKLGAISRTYHRNLYGRLNGSLNRGRLTDRFEAEWHIKSRRVKQRIKKSSPSASPVELLAMGARPANLTEEIEAGLRIPIASRLKLQDSKVLVEIPYSIVKLRDASVKLANRWTLQVRSNFERYLRNGYAVTDVSVDDDEKRILYVLESNVRI